MLAAVLCMTVGCAQLSTQPDAPKATAAKAVASKVSLYERLGGTGPITAVVGKFVSIVGADTRINGYFAKADLPKLKRQLVDQVCQASGGPCTYDGKDMKTTHKGMKITGAAFNALVEDLILALDTFNVPEQEKGELLSVLGPMKSDIVEVP
ncbi:MAG: group 1 truncated hemoglobin [Nitrospira sp.]|nr:group 1 truncated hemoglobin [Nitrospira sp.]